MKYYYSLFIFCFYLNNHIIAQNFNRPVPTNLFQYEFQSNETPTDYLLATLVKLGVNLPNPNYKSPYPTIFDPQGYIYWYSKPTVRSVIDFKYFPSIDKYAYTQVNQNVLSTILLDNQFEIVDTIMTNGIQDVHDFQLASNGNWLITRAFFDTMDLSSYYFNGIQGSTTTAVKGFGYEEQTPAGNLIQIWNSNDYLSPTETLDFWGYNPSPFDYCHGNAIEEDVDGNLLLSYRHLNSIHKINRQTGEVIWRLGGELSDFTFTNDNGFSGQHDMRILANGTISIFDNSNMEGNTRGVIYALDTIQWTATKISECIHPNSATSRAMGSYRLDNDNNQVLGYGLLYRPMPSASILDVNNNSIANYYFQDSVVTYRMLPYSLTELNRPEITCNWNGANWELIAPIGFTDYSWSNGETGQSIVLTATGTYQVWVNQGSGMLGSLPFEVTNLQNPCSVGLDNLTLNQNYTLYDLLGHEIIYPKNNTLYIKLWESGKVEKVFWSNQ